MSSTAILLALLLAVWTASLPFKKLQGNYVYKHEILKGKRGSLANLALFALME